METQYKIFMLETKTTYEPNGYDMRSVETSKLQHVGSDWIETKEDAVKELSKLSDDCSRYVILEVYR